MKNAKFWLAMAVAFDAIGFFSRFFGVLADGARVFGRGCDLQCSNDVVILFTTSALFFCVSIALRHLLDISCKDAVRQNHNNDFGCSGWADSRDIL